MSRPLKIDRKIARDFIDMLGDSKKEDFDFRCLPEVNKSLKPYPLRGTFAYKAATLESKQNRGYGIFVEINKSDGNGFKDDHIIQIRYIFIDIDTVGVGYESVAALLPPHMIIESSPGKFHVYWRVSDCTVEEFKHIQSACAALHNGDAAICNPSRIMRLPGAWHLKGEPFQTRFVECHPDRPYYTIQELIAKLGLQGLTEPEPSRNRATTKPEPSRNQATTKPEPSKHEFTDTTTGEIIVLEKWATLHRNFDIVGTLTAHTPGIIRGPITGGKQHITCPFESEHSNSTHDLSTFVANKEKNKSDSFIIKCMHAHCVGRDRLDFLLEMFIKGWLPVNILADNGESAPPPKVYFPGRDIAQDSSWMMLEPAERRIALDILRISWTSEDGTIPDDDWILARQLGINQVDWLTYRTTLMRTGWLQIRDGRMWNHIIKAEYDNALSAYNGWRRGGKKSQKK